MFKPKSIEIKQVADELVEAGYRVFHPEDPYWQTYLFFSDGKRIAYVEDNQLRGIQFSSVHVPCSYNGTGFACDSKGSIVDRAKVALDTYNPFGTGSVQKYRDLEHFLSKRTFSPLEEYNALFN